MSPTVEFDATPEAARRRLLAIRPHEYAETRNHLAGAVTRLSPYITHGFLSVRDVLEHLLAQPGVGPGHKLVFELGWREYFRHVWQHQGAAMAQGARCGPLSEDCYERALPDDIAHARTGLAAIDKAVRGLYEGWLHNHARLWLASYVVHVRKVHWRVGADWMYGHLLDGDLASNTLSWQWVAGTSRASPYLFNAENVRRHAPADWHVDGTVLDKSYEAMAEIACATSTWPAPGSSTSGVEVPPMCQTPPFDGFGRARSDVVAGSNVWLVHPWSLADPPPGWLRVAVCDLDFHHRWPWSALRWRFVGERMRALADIRWFDDGASIAAALRSARSVSGIGDPHLDTTLSQLTLAPPRAFIEPTTLCPSFSAWWARARVDPAVGARAPTPATDPSAPRQAWDAGT